ncbi:MAG TPA: TlpA disulfide reductase family protein [Allosphingosinicella sp.]|nr:TlpA disulfide reductase family protein [Allosphingosinicella sp.]
MAVSLTGCDRQNPSAPQGNGANAAVGAPPAAPAGASGNGSANAAAHAQYPTGRLDRSHAGTPAPGLAFEGPDGRPTRLAAFRGRPLLVNLWATWCGPCIVEMPALDALALRSPDGQGLQVLAVSQDMEGRQKVTDFFAARSFQRLQPFLDSEMGLMTALGLDTLPTTILYDSQGREVWRMVGMADWQGDRVAGLLREADAPQGARP